MECRPVEERNRPLTPFRSLLFNELSCSVRGAELDGTIASTLTVSGTGFGLLMGLSGMEAGAIHFAGMDSDLDQTNCSVFDKTLQEKRSTELAISELHTAWGLLLSASELEPGNGLYPRERPLTLGEIATCQSALQFSSSLLILTLVSSATASAYTQHGPYLEALSPVRLLNGTADSAASVLSLVALDSIKQGCLSLTVSLANATSLVLLSECLKEHKSFLSRKHNLQSLREFAEGVTASITALSGFLDDAISLLSSTYTPSNLLPQPSSLARNFDPPQPPDAQGSGLTAIAQLEASLSSLADITKIFWKDIKSCSNAASKILPRKSTANVLQLREFGLLYKSLVSSLKQASSVLRSTHASVTLILRHLGTSEPTVDERQQLDISSERFYLEGSLERALESFNRKQGHPVDEDGNPITLEQPGTATPCVPVTKSPLSRTVSNNLAILCIKLEQHKLNSALEFARSFIVNCPQKGASGQKVLPTRQARSAMALLRSSSAVGAMGRAEASIGIGRSKSWASVYQGKVSHSRPSPTGDANGPVLHQPAAGDASPELETAVFIESENGLAVVTSLARFMVAFFCNRPLLVAPATNPSIIPPAFSQVPLTGSRYLELDRSAITKSVRQQCLTDEWTVDHTLEMLILSGLWEEACDLISSLGDWKKSFLLASTYLTHARMLAETTGSLQAESCRNLEMISHHLAVDNVMSLLVLPHDSASPHPSSLGISQPARHSETPKRPKRRAMKRRVPRTHCTDPCIEGTQPHSVEVLGAISGTLRACAWVELDSVLLDTVSSLIGKLTETCKQLSLEVPTLVYLPAPPLYCPQPSITQEVGAEYM